MNYVNALTAEETSGSPNSYCSNREIRVDRCEAPARRRHLAVGPARRDLAICRVAQARHRFEDNRARQRLRQVGDDAQGRETGAGNEVGVGLSILPTGCNALCRVRTIAIIARYRPDPDRET